MIAGMIGFFVILGLAFYIYMAVTLMKTAQRLKKQNAWLAWIPVGNLVLMADMAEMHWWPVLLLLGIIIPFVGFLALIALIVFSFIWQWKICEARKRPGWWPLLQLVPVVGTIWGLVMWGILAWGE